MSVNLDKNRDQLVAAWKAVLDDKQATDWALFGYEPQSNDLRVVSTGDGGLAELNEDLNTSNIMYGFVRVLDPKTSLTKYVLVNWQVRHHRITHRAPSHIISLYSAYMGGLACRFAQGVVVWKVACVCVIVAAQILVSKIANAKTDSRAPCATFARN